MFQRVSLTTPICHATDPGYAQFVNAMGDGAGPSIDVSSFHVVHDFHEMINSIYPLDVLLNPVKCLKHAILAPTNDQVDSYNNAILNLINTDSCTYIATDTLKEADNVGIDPPSSIFDYATTHRFPGLPPHALHLKKNTVCRLLRNLSVDCGLVKNTRVLIVNLGCHLITVRLIDNQSDPSGHHSEDILIPHIIFTYKLPSFGHTLIRRHFPLAPCYATTFNSCQGLTLDRVGINLINPAFNHGQLYTAFSCVRTRHDLCLRLPRDSSSTYNVTFHELLTS